MTEEREVLFVDTPWMTWKHKEDWLAPHAAIHGLECLKAERAARKGRQQKRGQQKRAQQRSRFEKNRAKKRATAHDWPWTYSGLMLWRETCGRRGKSRYGDFMLGTWPNPEPDIYAELHTGKPPDRGPATPDPGYARVRTGGTDRPEASI